MRVLIVEDEAKIARALRTALEAEHYEVAHARTAGQALALHAERAADYVLLDLGLPGEDGSHVLASLRARGDATPVIVLTARDAVEDRVRELDAGADDYVVKPFAVAEVLARLRALQRRGRPDQVVRLKAGPVEVDLVARRASVRGTAVDLTPRELDLLEYLVRHEERVVSRDAIARDVWGETTRSSTLDNLIDVHVARLRRKLEDAGATALVHTVRGVGFVLREEKA